MFRRYPRFLGTASFLLTVVLGGCGSPAIDLDAKLDDAYNEGWRRALKCVEKEGGSAQDAIEKCR